MTILEGRNLSEHRYATIAEPEDLDLSVCIACGVPWTEHGRPLFEDCDLVEHPDDVPLVAAWDVP